MISIVLAGGSGTRLWPLSRTHFPKQFLRLDGKESFLQKTVLRNLELLPLDSIYVVTHHSYSHEVARQLREIDPILLKNIILEPEQRNTAPAIALALKTIFGSEVDDDGVVFVAPSDHLIAPLDPFRDALMHAEKLAKQGYIVTFGIRPSAPETGYGYIKAKGNRVEAFVEKPDRVRAQAYVQSGEYFWNSGMFVFCNQIMRQEMSQHCPEILNGSSKYSSLPTVSIDYAIMEKTQKMAMIPLDVSWSDVGSWENVYEILEKDDLSNATKGDVITVDTKRSLIFAEKRLVATVGLEDIILIETEDVVLAASKGNAERIKELVKKLKNLGRKQADEHMTIHRPWGSYTVLEEGERYKIKRIHIKPEQKLSLQLHYHRSEHWVVVTGTAAVTIGAKQQIIHEGESIFVPKSAVHRVENPGRVPLEIIEVQVGEYLGEDDIVRFDDIYGRQQEKIEEFVSSSS